MREIVKKTVIDIQDYISADRIKKRKEYEDQAIRILVRNKGKLTTKHIEEIITFLDSDFWERRRVDKRFGLLIWGRNRKLILENDNRLMNRMFSQIFDKENLDKVEVLISNLKGVAYGFVSCILYLKDRERYNIFLNATIEGIKSAFPEEADFFGPFKNRYMRFNRLANELKKECGAKPQEMDIILTDLPGRLAENPAEEIEQPRLETRILDIGKLSHSDVQGLLVELGNLLGYKTYVANPSKIYNDRTLAEWATLKEIPPFTFPKILNTVKQIDVIWFRNEGTEYPVACWEIEHTTDVTKGLLRLYQIKGLGCKLFIIAPRDVRSRFEGEVNKTPFYEIKERYLFRSYEQLVEFFELAKKYHDRKEIFL